MHKYDASHVDRLLRQERVDTIQPERVLTKAGLAEGAVLVDVGCGPGFFTLPAAAIVGQGGRVYAVDTQQEMLDALKNRGLPPNVTLIKSSEESIPIDDLSADLGLAAYVLHEAADATVFLKEIFRILKANGRLLVIEWKKQQEEHGPPMAERITEGEAAGLIEAVGFVDVAARSMNESHYMITAVKRG